MTCSRIDGRNVRRPLDATVAALALSVVLAITSHTGAQEGDRSQRTGDDLAAWLDDRFDVLWKERAVEPQFCDDATFARRVYLDLLGRIPSVAETREFLADARGDKHMRLVDSLLFPDGERPETPPGPPLVRGGKNGRWNRELYAENLARIWRRMMIPPGSNGAAMGTQFEPWLAEQFRENVGYDDLARRMVTGGNAEDAPRVAVYYRAVGGSPEAYAAELTRTFLGVRIACAQCHDHPFASWKQSDFWGMAAFFAGATPAGMPEAPAAGRGRITFEGVTYDASFLGKREKAITSPGDDPRSVLAEWVTAPQNDLFAATAVNRVWQSLLGRGLVPGADDLDLASEEERRIMLDPLAEKFAAADFDIRWLIAGICKSRAYRCASARSAGASASVLDGQRPLKTLLPEQLFASLEQALSLPVSRTADDAARHNGQMAQLVSRFDESAGRSPEDYAAGIPQALLLMNGSLVADATDLDASRTLRAVVDAPFLDDTQKIETLYLATLTRRPTDAERDKLLEHVRSRPAGEARGQAYAETLWALLNSPEFVLCR
ncbi:MAG: DUF1549 and DUF1553 domain-containing protein [Planctomycetes bacterium]|nr:DUF1549 and DUF1553 domain-containing protein [Planctomycetota bacterium]